MIKIYGIRERLDPIKTRLSDTINMCMVDALSFATNKRAHRFFPMAPEDFVYPEGRTEAYTVIEIAMMSGRSTKTKKRLIHMLFERIQSDLGIAPIDIEITIVESAGENWGFRGMTGDEADINYPIDV